MFEDNLNANRQGRFIWIVLAAMLVITILLPRLALLFNAPDVERVPDSYTREVLSLARAADSGQLAEYILSVQKYPLLGPFLAAPVAGAYYLFGKLVGNFETPADFARSYVLEETSLTLWFRLEALLFNLLALLLIYLAAKKFSPNLKLSGFFALLVAAASFYAATFSVSLRIHNLVFLLSALTLFLSLNYWRKPTFLNLILAFASAGLAFASSQSGLLAILLPLAAGFFIWKNTGVIRQFLVGPFVFAAVSLLAGYPGVFAVLRGGNFSQLPQFFLSPEHSDPSFSFLGLWTLLRDWFFALEWAWLWPLVALVVLFLARKKLFKLEVPDWLAIAHIFAFLTVFGTSSVTVGRFGLAVLPSIFFLAGRLTSRLVSHPWFVLPLSVFIVIGLSVNFGLGRAALGGDTRAEAAPFILSQTSGEDWIISTIDRHTLGIVATPDSLQRQSGPPAQTGPLGKVDQYILENEIIAPKSRDFYLWNPNLESADSIVWKDFSLVILNLPRQAAKSAIDQSLQTILAENGFVLVKEILPYRFKKRGEVEYFNWDMFGEGSAVNLFYLSRFGPPIYIFKR